MSQDQAFQDRIIRKRKIRRMKKNRSDINEKYRTVSKHSYSDKSHHSVLEPYVSTKFSTISVLGMICNMLYMFILKCNGLYIKVNNSVFGINSYIHHTISTITSKF